MSWPKEWKPGELLGPSWLPEQFQNRIESGLSPESLVTTWETASLRVLTWVAIALTIGATLAFLGSGVAWAQQRGAPPSSFGGMGDMNSMFAGFRFILRIIVVAVPLGIMAYYTWKLRPKDTYEASWLALGWCGVAYILGMG